MIAVIPTAKMTPIIATAYKAPVGKVVGVGSGVAVGSGVGSGVGVGAAVGVGVGVGVGAVNVKLYWSLATQLFAVSLA